MFDPLWDWLDDNRWAVKGVSYLISCALVFALLFGVLSGLAYFGVIDMDIAEAAAPTGGGDVAECSEWGKAGDWVLTRCVNDYTGEICIHSSSGMMQCKLD